MTYGSIMRYGDHDVKVLPDHPRDHDVPLDAADVELRAVSTYAKIAADTDAHLRHSIDRARFNGASWADIAHYLGVTRQAAQQRYGKTPAAKPAAEGDPLF